MASPFNPFSGRGQRGAAISTTTTASRGRGTPAGRGGQFPPRGSSAPRGKYNINRGRGLSQSRGRGRVRGAGASSPASSHSGSGTQSPQLQPTSSPFNQFGQQKPASNPFGASITQQNSPFAGIQNAPASQMTTQAPQFIQKQIAANPVGGGLGNVPVENATVLSQYHERYDQVSKTFLTTIESQIPHLDLSDQFCSSKSIVRTRGRGPLRMARWPILISPLHLTMPLRLWVLVPACVLNSNALSVLCKRWWIKVKR